MEDLGLTGKIGAVAALATEAGVNVLAMQETRLDAERSSSSAFRAAGWTLHQGPQGRDGRGAASAGVAIVTDVPAEQVEIPKALTHDGRVVAAEPTDWEACWAGFATGVRPGPSVATAVTGENAMADEQSRVLALVHYLGDLSYRSGARLGPGSFRRCLRG